MDINSINNQTAAAFQQNRTSGNGSLGKQEFLQLLVAQMKNQDPINPMDGTEFATQLAQFNSVEQLINVNSGLSALQSSQDLMSTSLTNSLAASITGKQVRAISDQVNLTAGEETDINFKLNNSADKVEVIIRTESGAEVRRVELSGLPSGENSWSWDGRNNSGDRMGDGNYRVEIVASSGDTPVDALTYVEGLASKVRYTANGVFLSVNNVDIPIGDVEEVGTDLF